MNVSVDDTSSHWRYWNKSATCIDGTGDTSGWSQLASGSGSSAVKNAFNRTTTWTESSDAAARLLFQGTAVYLYSVPIGNGGIMDIQLDEVVSICKVPGQNSTSPSSTLTFSKTGLDPSIVHQLTISKTGGTIINIDYVNVTSPPPSVFPPSVPLDVVATPSALPPCPSPQTKTLSTSTSPLPPPPPPTTTIADPGPSGGSTTGQLSHGQGILVGTIVGGVFAFIAVAMLMYCLRRRRKRNVKEPRELLLRPESPVKERKSTSRFRPSLGLWTSFERDKGSGMTTAKIPIFRRQTAIVSWTQPPQEQVMADPRGAYTVAAEYERGLGRTDVGYSQPLHYVGAQVLDISKDLTPLSTTSTHFTNDMFQDAMSEDAGHMYNTIIKEHDAGIEDEDEDLAAVADMFIKYSGVRFDDYESEEAAKTPLFSPIESSHNSHPPSAFSNVRNINFKRLTRESIKSIRSMLPRSRASGGTVSGGGAGGARSPRRYVSQPNLRGGPRAYAQIESQDDAAHSYHPMPELTFAYAKPKVESPVAITPVQTVKNEEIEERERHWDEETAVHDMDSQTGAEDLTETVIGSGTEILSRFSGLSSTNTQLPPYASIAEELAKWSDNNKQDTDDARVKLASYKWPTFPKPAATATTVITSIDESTMSSASRFEQPTHVITTSTPLQSTTNASKNRHTHVKRPSFGPREIRPMTGERKLSVSTSDGGGAGNASKLEEV